MAWLGEEALAEDQQDGVTPFSPRTNKDLIEEELFARRRDLFSGLDIVFFDTTSTNLLGQRDEIIGRHWHSKDHRPDLNWMVVGMVLYRKGNPVCRKLWPGKTADVKSLVPIAEGL
jgi:transposase